MSRSQELHALGRQVRRLRDERELSQEELAELAGLHRNYVGGIERGERNVGVEALFAVARALKVHITELFAEPDPHTEN